MINSSILGGYGRNDQWIPALAVFAKPVADTFFLFPEFISIKGIVASALR